LNGTELEWIYFDVQLVNSGAASIALSQITIDYWYTWEGTNGITQTWQCTYANGLPGGCGAVTGAFSMVSPARTDADHLFQLGFSAAAGNLAPGAIAELGPGFHKDDFSGLVQSNDYSYKPATTFVQNMNVTVYFAGALIYGTEPR
jgi:Cellulose binding domain